MMNKPERKLKPEEILHILDNQWLDTKDVMLVGFIGTGTARKIKKEITDDLLSHGIKVPRGLVPADKIIEYFNINLDYLREFAKEKSMPLNLRESEHTSM